MDLGYTQPLRLFHEAEDGVSEPPSSSHSQRQDERGCRSASYRGAHAGFKRLIWQKKHPIRQPSRCRYGKSEQDRAGGDKEWSRHGSLYRFKLFGMVHLSSRLLRLQGFLYGVADAVTRISRSRHPQKVRLREP